MFFQHDKQNLGKYSIFLLFHWMLSYEIYEEKNVVGERISLNYLRATNKFIQATKEEKGVTCYTYIHYRSEVSGLESNGL